MLYLLTFGPLALAIYGWLRLLSPDERDRLGTTGLLALAFASANALISSAVVLYFAIHPTPINVPPWKDRQILDLALLILSAPIGMLLGLVAAIRRAPKWLVSIVEGASVPLLVIGMLAAGAV